MVGLKMMLGYNAQIGQVDEIAKMIALDRETYRVGVNHFYRGDVAVIRLPLGAGFKPWVKQHIEAECHIYSSEGFAIMPARFGV